MRATSLIAASRKPVHFRRNYLKRTSSISHFQSLTAKGGDPYFFTAFTTATTRAVLYERYASRTRPSQTARLTTTTWG